VIAVLLVSGNGLPLSGKLDVLYAEVFGGDLTGVGKRLGTLL
jgi:hypothetical protein